MSMPIEPLPQRKRLRVPISCEVCRKKKIRCDKGRPSCKSCLKSKSVCQYQEMKFNGSQHQLNNILNLGSYVPKQAEADTVKRAQSAKVEAPSTYTLDFSYNRDQVPQLPLAKRPKPNIKAERDRPTEESEFPVLNNNIEPRKSNPQDRSFESFIKGRRSANGKEHYSESDTINFYDGYSPLQITESRVLNHGPLSWVTLVKKDIFVRSLWIKVLSTDRTSLILHSTVKNVEDDVRDADDTVPNELDADNKGKEYNRTSIGHPTTYRPDTEFGTIQLILRILPLKKYIWALIDRFFEVVYPFMPFLDYENFLRQIAKVIGERSLENVKVVQLGISKRLDFALVGTLLLILRFGYLSLKGNCDSYQKINLELRGLSEVDISVDFPTAAQYCLNQFRILRSSNLEILQCSLYMRIYHRYSPEDGDGADADSQIYNGMLLQMAISIGLNRDPEELLKPSVNPKLCQLRRKIWFGILQLETYHSLVLGSPSYTKVQSSNVKLPELNLMEYNSPNLDVERFVIYWITKYLTTSQRLEDINELVLNLKGDNKVSDVVLRLRKVEDLIYSRYDSLAQVLKLPSDTLTASLFKVRTIKRYLETISTILCVYFHLSNNYDRLQQEQNALYYMKITVQLSTELIWGFSKIVNKLHKYVGYGFDYYLTHSLLITMHRAIQAQFSLFSRLSHYELLLQIHGDTTDITTSIKEIQSSIMGNLTVYLKELKKLTPKYYYAWKMFKAQNLIYQIMNSDHIFKVHNKMVVANVAKLSVGVVPQYSILSSLNLLDLKAIYEDTCVGESSDRQLPTNTPTALSHILNATPSTTSSSVSLSPDHVHHDLMTSSTSKEVDDIWINLLNRKKESDIDESITYTNQAFQDNQISLAPEQMRQLQQPDFSALLAMNSLFPKPGHVPQASEGDFGVSDPTNSENAAQYGVSPHKNAPLQSQQPVPNVQHRSGFSETQQQQSQTFQNDPINLNGLLESQLNFNQLFGTPESPFNNFL